MNIKVGGGDLGCSTVKNVKVRRELTRGRCGACLRIQLCFALDAMTSSVSWSSGVPGEAKFRGNIT